MHSNFHTIISGLSSKKIMNFGVPRNRPPTLLRNKSLLLILPYLYFGQSDAAYFFIFEKKNMKKIENETY